MRARSSNALTLVLDYRPPSLNRLLQKHWSIAHREKRRAIRALSSAISRALCDLSTPTTWRARLNTSLMRLSDAASWMGIRQKRSRSRGRKKRSLTTTRKRSSSQFRVLKETEVGARQPTKAPQNQKTEGK